MQVIDQEAQALDQLIAADQASDPLFQESAGQPKEVTETAGDELKASDLAQSEEKSGTQTASEAKSEEANNEGTKDQSGTKPPEAKEAKPEEGKADGKTAEETKPQSKYAKELERREKSWAKLNEEKTALQKEREEFAKAQAEYERRVKEQSRPEYTPEDYEAAADRYEAKGQYDFANAARAEAKRLRENPAKPQADIQLERAIEASWNKAKAEFPEIVDAKSPVNARLRELLQQNADICDVASGPYLAARLARSEVSAARVPELESIVEKNKAEMAGLKAEVERLTQLTSIAPGGVVAELPQGEKPFEQLSLDEQEAVLKRELASAP